MVYESRVRASQDFSLALPLPLPNHREMFSFLFFGFLFLISLKRFSISLSTMTYGARSVDTWNFQCIAYNHVNGKMVERQPKLPYKYSSVSLELNVRICVGRRPL